MIRFVRRNQTVLVTIHNSRLQTFPVGNSILAICQFISGHIFQAYIKSQFAHGSNICTELHGSILVPACHVCTHGFCREEL